MSEPLRVGTFMTAYPLAIESSESVEAAQEMMTEHGVRHLPVMRDGELVSMITERDISLAVLVNRGLRIGETMLVDDVCVLELYKVDVKTPLKEVVETMAANKIGSVAVTRQGKLAGIFTAVDACRCLADLLTD